MLITFIILLFEGLSLSIIFYLLILLVCDRILDEKLRFYFYSNKLIFWFLTFLTRTFCPFIICVIYQKSLHFAQLFLISYVFLLLVYGLPKCFWKYFKLDININTIFSQLIYNLRVQLPRTFDKLFLLKILNNDNAFIYGYLSQICQGSCLVFEKFINIYERKSYVLSHEQRVIVKRTKYIIFSGIISITLSFFLLSIEFISCVLLLNLSLWLINILDRELEYSWWNVKSIIYQNLSLVVIYIFLFFIILITSSFYQYTIGIYVFSFLIINTIVLIIFNIFFKNVS